ncbi:MAG: hypothetical protein NTZ59_09090 [Bacteroidetes bacterium]|jgi:hypothetical protein|nr:hypothetical protein [Bacteroidota bacterium]
MKKYFTSFVVLAAILFINISAHKSIWPNSNYLHNEDKSACIQFQYLKGSNRIAEFRKIGTIIFKTNEIEDNKTYTTNDISFYDVTKILGDGDIQNDNNKITYSLNTNSNSSKVVIEENEISGVVSATIYK